MTISYNKTWEVMQGLEDSFNRIIALNQMIDDLQEAHTNEDQELVSDLITAIKAYVPVYLSQYEKASQRAWNNTVGEVRKIDNPYHESYNVKDDEVDYDEIIKYEESLTNIDYNKIDLSLD